MDITETNGLGVNEWAPDVIIYHDPCLDGFTAAWVCWRRWPEADFVGCNYGMPVPPVDGKHVLIVDFSFKRAELEAMAQAAASIVILDHHKSAAAELEPFRQFADKPERFKLPVVASMIGDLQRGGYPAICASFDMKRSGARMAWDFCFPGVSVPWLVLLVEDRDLWRFAFGDATRDTNLRLSVEPKNFERWSEILALLPQTVVWDGCDYTESGKAMRVYRDWLVAQIVRRAEIRPILGHDVPVVDCPYELASEVGDALCEKFFARPFAAMRTHALDGTSYSLRSRNGFDVSEVARRFGGGGHAGAAGFRVPACV